MHDSYAYNPSTSNNIYAKNTMLMYVRIVEGKVIVSFLIPVLLKKYWKCELQRLYVW